MRIHHCFLTMSLGLVLGGLSPVTAWAEEAINPATGSPRSWGSPILSNRYANVTFDRLESATGDGTRDLRWDLQAGYGGDYQRFRLKSEGAYDRRDSEGAGDLQMLYSRAVSAFWDLEAGWRHQFRQGSDRDSVAIGVQGLAPYRLETEASLFLGEGGAVSAGVELEYDLRLTQRLVMQPRFEWAGHLSAGGAADTERGTDSLGAGLRLRYEIRREFAPYVGVSWEREYGSEDRLQRAPDGRSDYALVAGLRFWF